MKKVTKRCERTLRCLVMTVLALFAAAGLGAVMHPLTAEAEDTYPETVTVTIRWNLEPGCFASDVPDSLEIGLGYQDPDQKGHYSLYDKVTLTSANKVEETDTYVIWSYTRPSNGKYYRELSRPNRKYIEEGGQTNAWGTVDNPDGITFDPMQGQLGATYSMSTFKTIARARLSSPPLGGNGMLPKTVQAQLQAWNGSTYVNIGDPVTFELDSDKIYYHEWNHISFHYDKRYQIKLLDVPDNVTVGETPNYTYSGCWLFETAYRFSLKSQQIQAMAKFVTADGGFVDPDKTPDGFAIDVLGSKDGGATYQQYAQTDVTLSHDKDDNDEYYDYNPETGEWRLSDAYWNVLSSMTWTLAGSKIDGYKAPQVTLVTQTYQYGGETREYSYYLITYVQDTAPVAVQTPASTWHCTHHYVWVTHEKATAIKDGAMRYQCEYCGTVKYTVPITAYYAFNKDTQEKVLNASQGATVKVQTPLFISFHEMVLKALQDRPDVTLVVDYKSGDGLYEMTIPAGSGTQLAQLFGDSQYAGFLYLGGAYETTQLPDDTRFDNVPDYLLWVGTEYAH